MTSTITSKLTTKNKFNDDDKKQQEHNNDHEDYDNDENKKETEQQKDFFSSEPDSYCGVWETWLKQIMCFLHFVIVRIAITTTMVTMRVIIVNKTATPKTMSMKIDVKRTEGDLTIHLFNREMTQHALWLSQSLL